MKSLDYLAPRKVDFFFLFTSFKQNTALILKKKKDTKIKFLNSPLVLNFPYKCERLKILIFFFFPQIDGLKMIINWKLYWWIASQ